jgi:hypothetical protein
MTTYHFSIASHGQTIIMVMDHNKEDGGGTLSLSTLDTQAAIAQLDRYAERFGCGNPEDAEDFVPGRMCNRLVIDSAGGVFRIHSPVVPNVFMEQGKCHAYLGLSVARKLAISMRAALGMVPTIRRRTRADTPAPGAPVLVRKRQRAGQTTTA